MTEAEITAGFTDIVRESLDDDTITLQPATTAAEVKGWDSVAMVAIIVAVEQRFGVRLRSKEIDKVACVGDMVALIHSKVA